MMKAMQVDCVKWEEDVAQCPPDGTGRRARGRSAAGSREVGGEAAGGELRSTQILPATALEGDLGFRRATLRARFVVTIEGLERTLYELEIGQPYLIINDITVRQERVRRRRDEPDKEPVLDVSLEVFGYLREQPA